MRQKKKNIDNEKSLYDDFDQKKVCSMTISLIIHIHNIIP